MALASERCRLPRATRHLVAMRPAFTLVELLVAIAVFTIGVLALAATAGLVAAHVGDGARLTGSAHLARSILDSLGTDNCGTIEAGAITREGITAEWSVTRDTSAAHIELSVASSLRRGTRRDVYRLLVPCVRS